MGVDWILFLARTMKVLAFMLGGSSLMFLGLAPIMSELFAFIVIAPLFMIVGWLMLQEIPLPKGVD